jgi:4-amino-4-deoxy-L-arabinose transferase-like glycosyltransferase
VTAPQVERADRVTGAYRSRLGASNGLPALAILLLAGLLLRLTIAYVLLPGSGFASDVGTFTAWASQLARSGPADFYATSSFADYPPGYLYVLWLLGGAGNLIGELLGRGGDGVIAGLIKLPPMLADIAIGWLLYRLVRSWRGRRPDAERLGLLAAGIYVFNPVTWYDSAIWGQTDAIGALVTLLTVAALIRGNPEGATALTVIAGIVKPQFGVVLAPLLVAVLVRRYLLRPESAPRHPVLLPAALRGWFEEEQGAWRLVSSLAVGLVAATLLLAPFSLDIPGFVRRMVETAGGYPYLSVNAYNGWALIGAGGSPPLALGGGWSADAVALLGPLPGVVIGGALLIAGFAAGMIRAGWRDDRRSILLVAIFLALAFFALPTRVHERYMFPVFALLPIFAVLDRRWLAATAALSLGALINLHAILTYQGYGTPNVHRLPLGHFFRSPPGVLTAVLLGLAGFAFVAWQLRRGAADAVVEEAPVEPAAEALAGASLAEAAAAEAAAGSVPAGWVARTRAELARYLRPISSRLAVVSLRRDRSAELVGERGGRLDRFDVALVLLVFLAALVLRGYRLDAPHSMYFDEVYHARTATEFLQDWRYGLPHSIYEYTHPHLAKYAMAVGIETLGDNRVSAVRDLGVPVRAVALEQRWNPPGDPSGRNGDRLYVASDAAVLVYDLATNSQVGQVAGAYAAIAVDGDGHMLYLADAAGTIWSTATADLEPQPFAQLDGLAGNLESLVVTGGRLVAVTTAGTIASLDPLTGEEGGRRVVDGAVAPVGISIEDGVDALAVGTPAGISVIDAVTLEPLHQFATSAPVTGMALATEGVDKPTIYAATGSSLQRLSVPTDEEPILATNMPMPAEVSEVYWNPSTQLIHALGTTQDGSSPTIYVVETHANAVFADAVLPFQPAAVALDVQPQRPAEDRETLLAFDGGGQLAAVDIGGNEFAWRFPGVLLAALMAACIYLLARFLFARRSVAVIAALLTLAEGMLFANARIAMNDIYVVFFTVAALTLFVPLWLGRWRSPLAPLVGLPLVGVLLGLALASKWVGAYAIGGVVLLILLRSTLGRVIALAGMIGLTAVLGYMAITPDAPTVEHSNASWLFLLLMIGLTVALAVGIALRPIVGRPVQAWLEPLRGFGLPWLLALAAVVALPLVVYLASYIPWIELGNRWTADFPAGHTGQMFIDLQMSMYDYHNYLRVPHAAVSPWWAWPLDLKPVWFQQSDYANSTLSVIYDTGNIVVFWLAIPAIGWLTWQAWRRRSLALGFLVIAVAALWLPWARIDRATFQYHVLPVVPFAILALAYFLAELWHGPSVRTWLLARVAAAIAIVLPALLWLLRLPLCGLARTESVNPGTEVCGALSRELALTDLQLGGLLLALVGLVGVGWLLYAGVRPRSAVDRRGPLLPAAIGMVMLGLVVVLLGAAMPGNPMFSFGISAEEPAVIALLLLAVPAWFVLRARDPRNFVVSALIAAGCWFVLFYPNIASLPVPRPLAQIHLGLLPTWNYGFQFGVNQDEPNRASPDLLAVSLLAAAVTVLVVTAIYAARAWQVQRTLQLMGEDNPEGA